MVAAADRTLVREQDGARTHILAAFWTVILFSLPVWWFSTSIERLPLPRLEPDVLAQLESLQFQREIYVDLASSADDARLSSLQQEVQAELDKLTAPVPIAGDIYTLRADSSDPSSKGRKFTVSSPDAELFSFDYTPELSAAQIAHFVLGMLPSSSTDPRHPPPTAADSRVVPYAPHVHLRFTLLLEDVSDPAGSDTDPTGWEVSRALAHVFEPAAAALEGVHTVSYSSQVQYHSPLAVEPFPRPSGCDGWLVGADDVKAFVNSEQWSVGAQGSRAGSDANDEEDEGSDDGSAELNFMLFVPRASRRPLGFEIANSGDVSHSFLIPQAGSLVVYNPPRSSPAPPPGTAVIGAPTLVPLFQQHLAHLRVLLGLPPSPVASRFAAPSDVALLARRRARESLRDAAHTLQALGRLLARNPQLRVGARVQRAVRRATGLLRALAPTPAPAPAAGLQTQGVLSRARAANARASTAFFDPSLMGVLYFPAEHKYAVYAPLFAPAGVPLVVAALKEARRRRKARRAAATAAVAVAAAAATAAGGAEAKPTQSSAADETADPAS